MIITTALKAEATPFVNEFRLDVKFKGNGYLYYQHASKLISVLVTGMGALKVEAALRTFYSDHPKCLQQTWVNVGIAGSSLHIVGELVWVETAQQNNKKNIWPISLPDGITSGAHLISLNHAIDLSTDAPVRLGYLYDMELATLTASLNTRGIKPLCAKVISDNQQAGIEQISPQMVTNLIRSHVPEIISQLPNISEK